MHIVILLSDIAIVLYFMAALGLFIYGLNCYVMIHLFKRKRKAAGEDMAQVLAEHGNLMSRNDLPVVTTQIAVYNELNVVERVLRSVCEMRYPAGLHEIQVVDDSSDETSAVIDRVVAELRTKGHDIHAVRRKDRAGYKAGALAHAMTQARGELIAIFDADFVPSEDYLLTAVPCFLAYPNVGLVQARWGHLNRRQSLLTRAQSIGIDGHFMVEQSARCWNGLFMNFNGTAGIWRKGAIEAGGGWEADTLTEDMDLSYRVQLAGWDSAYIPDLVVPAELPDDINSFKSQQFRWAKGSIQTAIKLMPRLLRADIPAFTKVQAFFHMTHYLVHPMMVTLAVLALPVLLTLQLNLAPLVFGIIALGLAFSMLAPSALYLVSQQAAHSDWIKRMLCLPVLMVIGIGIGISNTRAIIEALIGHESPFVRTPKRGDKPLKNYAIRLPALAVIEIGVGLYCSYSLSVYWSAGKYLVGPFLALYATGFLSVGLLTLAHSMGVAHGRR
jgi:cellulose synthase/poly-beta-1,6-N-acetylglucosamine synthase-like glycosyltransferase